MSNKVTISNTNNKVTITPQSNNSINASTTNTNPRIYIYTL